MSVSSDYEDAMKIIKDLQARGITPEEQAEAFDAMSDEIQTSSEEFIKEVKKFAERAVKTERVFEDIRVQLGYVDQNDYKDQNGVPIEKLQPKWTAYQKRYTELLWRSREAATITESYVRDFVNVVLPIVLDPDSTYEDNLKDLLAFADRTNPLKEKEQDDDFKKLQQDVETFALSFSHFADDEGARLSDEITTLNEKVEVLKKELNDLNGLILEMGIALGLTAAGGLLGLGIAINLELAPAVIVTILIAAITKLINDGSKIVSALVRRSKVQSEIEEKQREIDDLSKQKQRLEELRTKLDLCTDQSSDMFGRLANFSDMWSTCSSEARRLADVIVDVRTKAVQSRIELLNRTYSSTADALESYTKFLDTTDIIQPYLLKKGEN